MKTELKWYRGLIDPVLLIPGVIVAIADAIFISAGIWPMAIALTLIPILVSADHVIWNVSKKESKYDYTGICAGFVTLLHKD